MIKCVIFDMDGVLIDSRKAWFVIFNKALKKFEDKEIGIEEFNKEIWAVSIPLTVERYFNRSVEQIREFIHSQNEEFNKNLDQFDDTEQTLKELKQKGFLITVATNSPKQFTETTLKSLDLYDLFDYVLTYEDVKKSKPHPEMIQKTLDKFNLKKEQVVLVGDTYWDEKTAINADIEFIGFTYDSKNSINNLKEIFGFLS